MTSQRDVLYRIQEILQIEEECAEEIKQKRKLKDTSNQLDKDIAENESKYNELRTELVENERLNEQLKLDVLLLQIKFDAIQKVVKENEKAYEDDVKKMDELCHKIWKNREEFCDNVNKFIDIHGVAAKRNNIDREVSDKQVSETVEILSPEQCENLDTSFENAFESEMNKIMNEEFEQMKHNEEISDIYKDNYKISSDKRDIYGDDSSKTKPRNPLPYKSHTYEKKQQQLSIINFVNVEKKINDEIPQITRHEMPKETNVAPYNLVEIVEPFTASQNRHQSPSIAPKNDFWNNSKPTFCMKNEVADKRDMYKEFLMAKETNKINKDWRERVKSVKKKRKYT